MPQPQQDSSMVPSAWDHHLAIEVATDIATAEAVVNLQREVWGMADLEVIPAPQIVTAVHWGGILIVARHNDHVIGFSYGFLGCEGHELLLCSHMLGVSPPYRGSGIGYRLKLAQREEAIRRGLRRIVWTFDPLESRNAYLNLHKLGARVRLYLENHYGDMNDDINRGMPTDRLLADWRADDDRLEAVDDDPIPVLNPGSTKEAFPIPGEVQTHLLHSPALRVEVPADIGLIKANDRNLALRWRIHLRHALTSAFRSGYVATDLIRDAGPFAYYVLQREGE